MMMFRTLMTPSLVSWAATSPLLVGMFLSALHTKKTWIRRFGVAPSVSCDGAPPPTQWLSCGAGTGRSWTFWLELVKMSRLRAAAL